MTNESTLDTVRDFFATMGYAGLILPSGWFGRPFDNLHQLTRSEASEQSLLIELDNQLVLTFSGELWATPTDEGLRLGGFTSLAWDWTEIGSTASHHEQFMSGEVHLVASMG